MPTRTAPTLPTDRRSPPDDGPEAEDAGGEDAGGKDTADQRKNALEWAMTALGAAITLFVLGFLTYHLLNGGGKPADLAVTLGQPQRRGSTVEVPVEVKNRGGRVVEATVVEVCAGPEACAQVTFPYLPFESTVSGVVGLEAPLTAPLTTRVVSYRNP